MVTKRIMRSRLIVVLLLLSVGIYCPNSQAQSFGSQLKSGLLKQMGVDTEESSPSKGKQKKKKTKKEADVKLEEDDVKLTVLGIGKNKEEAIKVALRSAIEQTFGSFVSSNTQLINDELVKDEIATVSSGNIKEYKCISEEKLLNGEYAVSVVAVVSTSKLVQFCKNKGMEVEFAGATFGMNMKIRELNKINEEKAFDNLLSQLSVMVNNIFDYEISMDEPYVDGENFQIPAHICIKYNKNANSFYDVLYNTLESLALSIEEITEYKKANIPYYYLEIRPGIGIDRYRSFRSTRFLNLCKELNEVFTRSLFGFEIVDNLGITSAWEDPSERFFSGRIIGFGMKTREASDRYEKTLNPNSSYEWERRKKRQRILNYNISSIDSNGESGYIRPVGFDEIDHYLDRNYNGKISYKMVLLMSIKSDEMSKLNKFSIQRK